MVEQTLPIEAVSEPPPRAAAKRKTSFGGDVLKLVSGTTIAQALGVLVTPLLTRLYAPEAFGALALFTAITSIIGVVACLRYELAIMLPESDEEAANLLAVSLLAVVAITALTVPIVTLGRPLLLRLLNAPQVGPYLWLVPPVVFFGGVFSALNYWNSRTKHFGRLSVVRVVSSASTHVAKLGAGFAGYATTGTLIGATLLGSAISTGMLARRILREDGGLFRGATRWLQMAEGIGRYRKFPLIDTWSALLNTVSWQLPALMLSYFFSVTVVGHYALGLRVLQLPMSLIGGAIGQVFFQRAAQANAERQLGEIVESTLRRLFAIGLFPVLTLAIAGRSVFSFVFGPNWAEAGVYSQILAPWILFWFISSPLSTVYSVLERQSFLLCLNVAILSTRLLSLAVGGMVGSPRLGLALFSLSGVLTYGYIVWYAVKCSFCKLALFSLLRLDVVDLLSVCALIACTAIPLPDSVITVTGALVCLLYLARVAWRDPALRRLIRPSASMRRIY
ncbi:MAG: lipopolysaccharide biosynthesis protein [Anaerolineae bacterium]